MLYNNKWYTVDKEFLTESEKSGAVPLPKKVFIVIHPKKQWSHFSQMLIETVQGVKNAFSNTELEYKIENYSGAVPSPNERPASFFFKNLEKVNAPKSTLNLIRQSIIEGHVSPDDFHSHHFYTPLYTGEKVVGIDTKQAKIDSRLETRTIGILDKWNISFSAGFNHEKRWFYKIKLMDSLHQDSYRSLIEDFYKNVEIFPMLKERKDADESFGTEFRILG